ncbi:hypothetical protein ACCC85_22335 [Kosakonia cowanii]|nr:hypothetical protein [Pantoea allii]
MAQANQVPQTMLSLLR